MNRIDKPYKEIEFDNEKLQYKLRCLELASGMGTEYDIERSSYVLETAGKLYKWLLSDDDKE